ncbi:MAG TPA: CheR family methyltransferase, partial [Longimicrobiaceae bacterium]|nr:CheR family methyltransferase [Longimicrobiaceae bacterium]
MSHAGADASFETLLEFLRDNRGFDFTGYKRSTLVRRVRKRMDEVDVPDYDRYREYLAAHPEEFAALFNTILINVTGFWRDAEAWEALTRQHLPAVLAGKYPEEQVRVWSAGCASGEETYTLAILLAEQLGVERFHDQVKIYATDVDDEALLQARAATYTAKALEPVPEALREKYFEPAGARFAFRSDLRRLVIFGRHDLVRDAPISHLDLLVSRNTLMYFTSEIQARIVNRFHFALNDGGLLFLGKAEMMRSYGSLFAPLNLKARIFQKVSRATLRDRLTMLARPGRAEGVERLGRQLRLRDAALNAEPAAQVVVDLSGAVALANAPARALFGLAEGDVGRPLQDLTLSYRPVELRSRIDLVYADRRPALLAGVEHPSASGEMHHFDVHVVPLTDHDGTLLGASVSFVDVTPAYRLQAELQETNQELETAFEELQSTNEELET